MPVSLRVRSRLNSFFFALRNGMPWGRAYREAGTKDGPLLPAPWKALGERYGLDRFAESLNEHSYLLNLSKLEQLVLFMGDRVLDSPPGPFRILDVGSQNFVYAPALHCFFKRWTGRDDAEIAVIGLEVDAHRRYAGFHTRRTLAQYYGSLLPRAAYHPGDVRDHSFSERFDVVTLFRPFLTIEPVIRSGLPASAFHPNEVLSRAAANLQPEGWLVLSLQTEEEAQLAREALRGMGLNPTPDPVLWTPPAWAVEKRPLWGFAFQPR